MRNDKLKCNKSTFGDLCFYFESAILKAVSVSSKLLSFDFVILNQSLVFCNVHLIFVDVLKERKKKKKKK